MMPGTTPAIVDVSSRAAIVVDYRRAAIIDLGSRPARRMRSSSTTRISRPT
jgi:hypothetical protein